MGMKKTEVGLLPEEWDVQNFSDTFRILNNNTFSRADLNYESGQFKNIHYGDVLVLFPEVLDCSRSDVPYINDDCRISGSAQPLQDGDVIIADTAEDETVGKATEILNSAGKKVMSGLHTIPCRVKNGEFAPKWLGYYINSHIYHDQLLPFIHGIKVSSISKGSLGDTLIVIPSVPEQRSIVEALSDIDELINDLQKLIRKKKDIRQGTMQMLVTGKKRLDGHSGEWVKINLAKNSKLKARIGWQGLTTAEYLDEGYSFLITGTDFDGGRINWNGCHFVNYDRYAQDPNIQVTNGDLLLTKDGTIGKVAFVTDLKRPATLNSGVFLVKPITDAYTAHFMFYVLESSVFKDFLQQLSAGSTINHLYQKDLVKFDLFVPPTKEEQEAIATILFDMDSDIHKLEEKLSKYQKVKQGMMEELLTGKVRLS
ncbi:restriction endonuclease subunit S [Enterocloster clostridioformis]|uniref:Type I restriction modification DNA specificity domain-containing protein n=1 Tax=[Clostridium] clostridioforme 90A8 TaxID=999408 RepID=A0A0E2H9V4_9FIRM|nr:restriction endonuclease subunit S [Enterocloster clostridioformis]ENZ13236.1 hypothetical protein HMPREF1090_02969 [[Clostridium] clostridioforme 90A8]